jgi:hypothetical protein
MSSDRSILAAAILPLCGKCRVCGCGGDQCSLPEGEKCCWVDALRTLCSNPRCVTAADISRKRYLREQRRTEDRAKSSGASRWKPKKVSRKRRQRKTKGKAA